MLLMSLSCNYYSVYCYKAKPEGSTSTSDYLRVPLANSFHYKSLSHVSSKWCKVNCTMCFCLESSCCVRCLCTPCSCLTLCLFSQLQSMHGVHSRGPDRQVTFGQTCLSGLSVQCRNTQSCIFFVNWKDKELNLKVSEGECRFSVFFVKGSTSLHLITLHTPKLNHIMAAAPISALCMVC